MHDEPTPRDLGERTGKHYCVKCLALTPVDEFLRNDHMCDPCAEEEERERGTMSDER
jgi:hypothetical protein